MRKLNFGKKLLLGGAALAAFAVPVAFGLAHAAPRVRQSQDAPNFAEFKYEVSWIKPHDSSDSSHHTRSAADEYIATNVSLSRLVRQAYGLGLGLDYDDGRVLGAQGWMDSSSFDIDAKMESATADALGKLRPLDREAARQHMLQAFLAERFKLVVHEETKELPVYSLIVAKNGPKLHEAKAGDTYENAYKLPNGTPAGSGFHSDETGKVTGQGVSIASLTQWLTRQVGRPVLDKTGLSGKYDLTLSWTKDQGEGSDDPAGPSIFDAVQQQLGLKLESGKGPVRVIVIDHAERPSGN